MFFSSSASVVNSPPRRNAYRVKSANSSSSSRARSGSVRTKRGDRGERVVDEVRADLGPQRAQLGLDGPGAGAVELGQLDLGGHPAGHLVGGPDQAGGVSAP